VSYAWDLGDGTTASGAEVSHSYSAAGSYRVTLTVTDNDGLSSSASLLVQVNEPVS
jgi:PKD repeat protein